MPRGYLILLFNGGCSVFQGIVLPIFSRTGYQKKATFLEPFIKTCQRGKFR